MSVNTTNDSLVIKTKEFNMPIYLKGSIFLLGIFVFIWILYIAKSIIIPLVFATIISIVLHPMVNYFVKKRINRVAAIAFTLFLTILIISAFGALLFSQASQFSDSWPILVDRFTDVLNQTTSWVTVHFDLSPWKTHQWVIKTKTDLINNSSANIGKTLITLGSGLIVLILIPVYIFMLLYYHPLLIDFVRKLFGEMHQREVTEVVSLTKKVIQRYLIGLIIEATIVAILYTVTLLVLGIDYAILLGIIGALLNLIPYIGGLTGAMLPMMVAMATKSTGWTALYILGAYYIIHLIDTNFIIPKIVASKVKINALFSVIAVIAGNALWDIPGMILALPLLAIVKLIFDHIEQMKPWGFLLGDAMPTMNIIGPILKKL